MHAVYEPYHISLSGTVPLLLSICDNCLKNGIDCRGKQANSINVDQFDTKVNLSLVCGWLVAS